VSDFFTGLLLQISEHDYSWLAKLSLWVLPFAHEDLAIILGGYIVVNKVMPVGLVAASIYFGMVASDFALYGIGVGARRLPWLSRYAVDGRAGRLRELLKRNLFGLVALCRFVPGVVFIAFIACGWARVPLARFTAASLVVSALYLPLMLYLVVVSGDALDNRVGAWAWPVLLAVTVALGFIRWRVFTFQNAAKQAESAAAQAPADTIPERRLPILFHLPLIANWIRLGWRHRSLTLPTVVNPRLPIGGMWGGSRSQPLLDVASRERAWTADFALVRRSPGRHTLYADLERVRQALCDAQLTFPLVAKPDAGCRGPTARRIDDVAGLRDYLGEVPGGAKLMLQRFVPHAGDAALLYARLPGAERGRILALTLRHEEAPGASPRASRTIRDANRCITPQLEARFDAIAKSMSEFHYGRFDLRFSSIEKLMQGEEFSIVGIHGIGAEAIDVRDPRMPLDEACRRLIERQRILFLIGDKNRARGFVPAGCARVLAHLFRRTQFPLVHPASA
jgi:membrane protein DedA with SNARE-associated domain